MFISVDLPDPDGPMIAINSPCMTFRLMPCNARNVPASEA
jgi:hypothetical protein